MFDRAVPIVTVLGFRIRVDPSWLLIASLIVWSLFTGYFPQTAPGLGEMARFVLAVLAMLALFACLVLHELAHSLVARRFGLAVGNITLFLFGGVAELENEPESALSEFWIAVAGPVMSLLLAALAFGFSAAAEAGGQTGAIIAFFDYLAAVNLILALFNVLPAFPLDGGRVLRALLWRRKQDLLSATRVAARVGQALALALIVVGFIGLVSGHSLGGLWQILIGVFLLTAAGGAVQQAMLRSATHGRTVKEFMTERPWITSPSEPLDRLVDRVMLGHGASFVPVCDDGSLLGYVDPAVVRGIERSNWSTTQVGDVFVTSDRTNTVPPNMPAAKLVRRMLDTGQRKFLVSSDERLLGVVTLADILGYIDLANTLGAELPPNRRAAR